MFDICIPFVRFSHPRKTLGVTVIGEALSDPLPHLPLKLLIVFKKLALLNFLISE